MILRWFQLTLLLLDYYYYFKYRYRGSWCNDCNCVRPSPNFDFKLNLTVTLRFCCLGFCSFPHLVCLLSACTCAVFGSGHLTVESGRQRITNRVIIIIIINTKLYWLPSRTLKLKQYHYERPHVVCDGAKFRFNVSPGLDGSISFRVHFPSTVGKRAWYFRISFHLTRLFRRNSYTRGCINPRRDVVQETKFVDPQYGTRFMSPLRHTEF